MAEKEITRQKWNEAKEEAPPLPQEKDKKRGRQAKLILAKRMAMVNRLNSVESVVA